VKLEVPCLPEKLIKEGVVFAPEYKHDSFMFTAKVPAYALIEMSSFLNGGQWPESKCVIKGRLKSDSMHMNLKVCLCVTLAHRERYVEASESERGREAEAGEDEDGCCKGGDCAQLFFAY